MRLNLTQFLIFLFLPHSIFANRTFSLSIFVSNLSRRSATYLSSVQISLPYVTAGMVTVLEMLSLVVWSNQFTLPLLYIIYLNYQFIYIRLTSHYVSEYCYLQYLFNFYIYSHLNLDIYYFCIINIAHIIF